jgi:predicted mannosyl-3-phosphoglycerate phosphatase (HAD superfamily)
MQQQEIVQYLVSLDRRMRTLEEFFKTELWKKANKQDLQELAFCVRDLVSLFKQFSSNFNAYNTNQAEITTQFCSLNIRNLPEYLKDILSILKTCDRAMTYKEIADKAGKDIKTVRNYIYRLKELGFPINFLTILGKRYVKHV